MASFVAVLAVVAAYAVCARPAVAGYAAHVVDAHTGAVLHSENADVLNYPASLAKMMTLYLVFESLDHGVIGFHTALPVSARRRRSSAVENRPSGGRADRAARRHTHAGDQVGGTMSPPSSPSISRAARTASRGS